jgi:hypothetical protein
VTALVYVDFNECDGDQVCTALSNASGSLSAGQQVLVAFFTVAWRQFRDYPEATGH